MTSINTETDYRMFMAGWRYKCTSQYRYKWYVACTVCTTHKHLTQVYVHTVQKSLLHMVYKLYNTHVHNTCINIVHYACKYCITPLLSFVSVLSSSVLSSVSMLVHVLHCCKSYVFPSAACFQWSNHRHSHPTQK